MGIKPRRLEADRDVNDLGARFVENEDYVAGTSSTYIDKDQILAVTGRSASYTTVSKAQADVALDRSQLWLAKQDIWEYGEVSRFGVVEFNTTGSTIGNPVYLSDTAGSLSLTPGTVPIVVGKVLSVGATGEVSIDLTTPHPAGTGFAVTEGIIPDPGDGAAITVTESGTCAMTSAGVETRTVADPSFIGQTLLLALDTDGGTVTVTFASDITQTAGENVATFDDAGDYLYVKAITVGGTPKWRLIINGTGGALT